MSAGLAPNVSFLQNPPNAPLASRPSRSSVTQQARDLTFWTALDMAKHLSLPLKEAHIAADAGVCVDDNSHIPASISGVVGQVCGT